MANGNSDSTARNRIISDIDKNFFVEASAGSGKTTMLVNRMVAMVESGIDIDKICAITFTKAAAGEFFDRFQEILITRSDPNYNGEDEKFDGQLMPPTPETRELCNRALQNIDLCFMGTIDSFCNKVLTEYPTEAGILSDSQIIEDAEFNAIVEGIYVDICNGKHGDELKKLADDFNGAIGYNAKKAFCTGMQTFMGHRNAKFDSISSGDPDLDKRFEYTRRRYIELINFLKDHQELRSDTKKSSTEAWEKIDKTWLALTHSWNENLDNLKYGLKALKEMRLAECAKDCCTFDINSFYEYGKSKSSYYYGFMHEDADKVLNSLETIKYEKSYTLFLKCISLIEKELLDKGRLTYFDNLYYLSKMLEKDASSGGDLIRHISKRHRYFLIDEFQDTDPLQAVVFFYLASDDPKKEWYNCIPRARSLFIVGDSKQSIYRFKNADVDSFKRVRDHFVKNGGEVLKLTRNFRSKRELCEYFNKAFVDLMPEDPNDPSHYEPIDPLPKTVADEFKGVFRYSVDKKGSDPGQVSEIIRKLVGNKDFLIRGKKKDDQKLRQIKFSDIMIITTSKENLALYMDCFEKDKIPYRVEGKLKFDECEALKEIYKLYSIVADPSDQISLYGVLTGKLFGFNPEDLLAYKNNDGDIRIFSDFDIDACKDATAKDVGSAIKDLDKFRNESSSLSPSALMSKILEKYDVFSFTDPGKIELIYYTLELLRRGEKTGDIVSLTDGQKCLKSILNNESGEERCLNLSEDDNRVHLANLHKIKGLEAPIVFLVYAGKKAKDASLRIEYNQDSVDGYCFALSNRDKMNEVFFRKDGDDPKRNEENVALEAEDNRKVYVAATRARNVLIVCDSKMWTDISEFIDEDIVTRLKDVKAVEIATGALTDPKALYNKAKDESVLKTRGGEESTFVLNSPSRLKLVSKVTADADDQTSDDAEDDEALDMHRKIADIMGTMTHKLMEMMVTSRNTMDIDPMVSEIISEYRSPRTEPYEDRLSVSLKKVADTMRKGGYAQTNGLPQDILGTLLSADEVHCEVPFTYKENGKKGIIWNGIMDVIYRKGEDWHIVDYKTNIEGDDLDTEYQNQMRAYENAFRSIMGKDADAKTYHIDI